MVYNDNCKNFLKSVEDMLRIAFNDEDIHVTYKKYMDNAEIPQYEHLYHEPFLYSEYVLITVYGRTYHVCVNMDSELGALIDVTRFMNTPTFRELTY